MREGMSNPDFEVITLLQRASRAVQGRELPELTLTTRLAEIGVDSVGLLEMVGSVEDQIGLRLPDEEIARLATVADVADLIERTRRAAAAG
jgi:acyl carrier protein